MKDIKELFVKGDLFANDVMCYENSCWNGKCFYCLWKFSKINIGATFLYTNRWTNFVFKNDFKTADSLIVYVFCFVGVVKWNWANKSRLK